MSTKIDFSTHSHFELLKNLGSLAAELGKSLYVVGGFVRDFLMNRQAKMDLDFVTEGDGIALAEILAQKIRPDTKVSIFRNYGTAMFRYKGIDLEFVGARKESYFHNSRKPEVTQGSLKDDQSRRDFTINAMAIDLHPERFGELLDPFGGVQDIGKKILRTPLDPEITWSDDPLRMMRAIRFASNLDFEIEEEAFKAIQRQSHRIKIVSIERIMTEFNKILMSSRPSIGLGLLENSGLMKFILPELSALKGIEEVEGQSHKDNFWHTLEVVDNISLHTDNLWLRWAALLHDVGKAPTKKFVEGTGWTFHGHEFLGSKMVHSIFKRLKLPLGADLRYVKKIVKMSSRPIALVDEGTSDAALRRLMFEAGEDLEDLFTLCKADITTKNKLRQQRYKKNFDQVSIKIKKVEEKDRVRNFQPPISGEEIMSRYSIGPCREIGILKEQVKEAILEGEIPNEYQPALDFVDEKARKMGLLPK